MSGSPDHLGRLSLLLFLLMMLVGRFGPTAFTFAAWWILLGAGVLAVVVSLSRRSAGRKLETWLAAALFAGIIGLTAWSSLASPVS